MSKKRKRSGVEILIGVDGILVDDRSDPTLPIQFDRDKMNEIFGKPEWGYSPCG